MGALKTFFRTAPVACIFPNAPAFCRSPAINPIMPQENICQGVQGPCPKMKLLTNPVSAPVKNPLSGPKTTPVMMTMALTGLKFGRGTMANTVLPTTPRAAITAMGTMSLAWGFLPKIRKKGTKETMRKNSASATSEFMITMSTQVRSSPNLSGGR